MWYIIIIIIIIIILSCLRNSVDPDHHNVKVDYR